MEREVAHEMAVVGLVKRKAGEEQASLRDALASVSSHSRRKSAEQAFAGGSSNYPPSPMAVPLTRRIDPLALSVPNTYTGADECVGYRRGTLHRLSIHRLRRLFRAKSSKLYADLVFCALQL